MTRDELIAALLSVGDGTEKVYTRLDGYARYASADQVFLDEDGDITIQEKPYDQG